MVYIYIYILKCFSLGLKKNGVGHLACSPAIPAMSQDILGTFSRQLLQSLQSRGLLFVFHLSIMQKDAFEVFSFLPFPVWVPLSPRRPGTEPGTGQS